MDRLDPVAVVDVEVDVEHPQPVAPRPGDRQRRIVVDAEPRRPVGHRVMEPAARMEGVLHVAAQDGLDGPQRATGHHRAGLVHPANGGSSPPSPIPASAEPERVGREPLDGLDVPPRVDPQQLFVRGGLWRQTRLGADRSQQLDPRSEPAWRQRMARPEVIRGGARPVHQQHGMAR